MSTSKNVCLCYVITLLLKILGETYIYRTSEKLTHLAYAYSTYNYLLFLCLSACEIGWSYYMNNCYYLSKTGAAWENAKV